MSVDLAIKEEWLIILRGLDQSDRDVVRVARVHFALSAPLTLDNFIYAWKAAPFARYFLNTFVLVTLILACQLVFPPSGTRDFIYREVAQWRHNGADSAAGVAGHRHGSRTRSLMGTFGKTEITVPRARLETPDGKTTEWHSSAAQRPVPLPQIVLILSL